MNGTDFQLPRRNLAVVQAEAWRPPAFEAPRTTLARCRAFGRRLLDLQAASIWNDMKRLLPQLCGEVLDVGCGAQPYRDFFSPRTHLQGIDHALAGDTFGYHEAGVIYYTGETWPIESASRDAILSTETLEHVPRPAVFLAEAARCLKPGGRLVLTVPFAARWHYIPHDYYRFTPSSLHDLLTEAGFDQIAVYARGNALTVACYKMLSLLFPILLPQQVSLLVRAGLLPFGLLLLPLVAALAVAGQCSLHSRGGDDCLGYTVLARRREGGTASG
jgi:SAM-dependent methyltransferase